MQKELLKMALDCGAEVAGWASLEGVDLENLSLISSEEAHRYRSALVIAKRHKPSALKALSGIPTKAYDLDYRRLNRELFAVVRTLEDALTENGIACRAVNPTQTLDEKSQRGLVSHRALAERAGIGVRGRNNLILIDPPFPPVRLCSLLTELRIEEETRQNTKYPCDDCDFCARICPVEAIGETWRDFDLRRCLHHLEDVVSPGISPQICGACLAACPRG